MGPRYKNGMNLFCFCFAFAGLVSGVEADKQESKGEGTTESWWGWGRGAGKVPAWRLGPEVDSRSSGARRVATGLLPGPEHKQQRDPGVWRHRGSARPWRAHSLQRAVWKLGLRKSSAGVKKRCAPLDLADPVSEVDDAGEDTGVDGVPAVQTPAGQPHQNPGTEEITDEGAPGITLGKKKS